MQQKRLVAKTVWTSLVAGIRSTAGPTMVALLPQLVGVPLEQRHLVKAIAEVFHVGELIADKLPIVPNRIWGPALLARAASGAMIGAMVCKANNADSKRGAAIGACSAVASAYASFYLRCFLTKKLRLPDFVVALAEDAIVLKQERNVVRLNSHRIDPSS